MADAAQLLRDFEGFSPTPYWDVNAYRAGYGSDTVTLESGAIVPVTQRTVVTRADADRDLARRIDDFQQDGVIRFVGQDAWDALAPEVQAALTSISYNYGGIGDLPSLQQAIRSGDQGAIADAVAKRAGDNSGVNRTRRNAEADIIRNAQQSRSTARDNIATQRAEQSEMRNRTFVDVPPRRPDMVNGNEVRPLPAPAPLDPNNPLGRPSGVLEPGNIDLNSRPVVPLQDGSVATVRSMSFNEDGQEILVPTVSPQGRILTDQQAIDLYHKTGQHLGKFATPEAADAYAEGLHQDQEKQYGNTPTVSPIGPAAPTASARSPALASALARLGAAVATKANIDLGQHVETSGTAAGSAGASATGSARIDLNANPGNVRTASGPDQQPIPLNVRPASVLSPDALKTMEPLRTSGGAAAKAGVKATPSTQPQYLTKTRQVPVEAAPTNNSLGMSGGATGTLGLTGAVGGSLSLKPKPAAPTYRTETYQVPNPLYVAPKGPTPEQIDEAKRLAAAVAARKAEEQRVAQVAALKPAISEVGGGGAYLTTPFQEDRFQTTTNSLQPAANNNDRWTTGYKVAPQASQTSSGSPFW